jgi:hypothetical protein
MALVYTPERFNAKGKTCRYCGKQATRVFCYTNGDEYYCRDCEPVYGDVNSILPLWEED